MDDSKFVYETIRTVTFTINIPRECIDKNTNTIVNHLLGGILRDNCKDDSWIEPYWGAPVKVEIDLYAPIPKSRPDWFKAAAKKGIIPCVSGSGFLLVDEVVLALTYNRIISRPAQIYSTVYTAAYSIKPRIIITVSKVMQNIGDIKTLCVPKRRRKNELQTSDASE